jgi:hypothetical protein
MGLRNLDFKGKKMKKLIILFIFCISSLFGYGSYKAIDKAVTGDNKVHGTAWTPSSTYGYNQYYGKKLLRENPSLPNYHAGIDISTPNGTKIYSLTEGTVSRIKTSIGAVFIKLKNQKGTLVYMHLSKINVKKDDSISINTLIGKSGKKGATGYHLHLAWLKSDFYDKNNDNPVYPKEIAKSTQGLTTTATDKTYDPKDLKKNDISHNPISIIDGAGSLVSPNEYCWGCDRDQANMQSHSGKNSTVVFQWRYDKNSCSQIDISANRDIGNVFIRAKGWKDKTTKVATSVKLSSSPISIRRPNRNSDWTTLAVTTQKPLTKEAKIYAYCKKKGSDYLNGDRGSASKDLVNFELDYVWSGTGSLISQSKKSNYEGFGHNRDWAITYFKKKSLTTFQWDTTTCHEITITNGKTNDYYGNNVKVDIKGWNSKNWESACHELPCTLKKPNDYYYILKVKSPVGAITKGYIQVKCKD